LEGSSDTQPGKSKSNDIMKTLIIAVAYLEPSWIETRNCLLKCDNKVVVVDREGVGSLAAAYNHAFKKHAKGYEYVWFVSNITFSPFAVHVLESEMENRKSFAAMHPVMQNSDHAHMRSTWHLRQRLNGAIDEVPFVEFTAPIVRANVFNEFMLDEQMPYVGHDLDWGYRVRQAGFKIGLNHKTEIEHAYIRHSPDHAVTAQRMRLRRESDDATVNRLIEKYGPDYKKKLHYLNKLDS
jgi:GT2 family glycosyltransferase